jgi:hypothetical protein
VGNSRVSQISWCRKLQRVRKSLPEGAVSTLCPSCGCVSLHSLPRGQCWPLLFSVIGLERGGPKVACDSSSSTLLNLSRGSEGSYAKRKSPITHRYAELNVFPFPALLMQTRKWRNHKLATLLNQQTALFLKIAVVWDVTERSLVDIYQCFGRTCCLHLQGKWENSSTLKSIILRDMLLCSLVEIYRRFGGTYCLYLHSILLSLANKQVSVLVICLAYFCTLKMEAVRFFELSMKFCRTARRLSPEDCSSSPLWEP